MLPRVFPDGARPATRVAVRRELGELSGAWVIAPLTDRRWVLVIYPHSVDAEGLFLYLTVGAAVMGLGVGISVLLMLLSARWIVHRPLRSLVDRLIGALARDNQRRRAAEQAAVKARTEAERHLAFRNNLIDASDRVCIVATDLEDRIQIFSRGAEALLHYRADETVGKMTLEDLRRQTQRVPSQEVPLRSLLQPSEGEEFFVDKNGQEHLVLLNESDITDADGRRYGRLLVFVDVTRRKRLEAELQLNELQLIQSAKMASLGEMATGVAHEINQPLNNIGIIVSRVLRKLAQPEGCDTAFMQERLGKVESQIRRASKIIDQLRTFGHPRGPQISAAYPRRAVENVLDLMRQQLSDRAITLQLEIPQDLPRVVVDEAQLEQVLVNLLNNARDALAETPIPEPQITIRAKRDEIAGRPAVAIQLIDNGPGMAQTVRERVFQPFFTTKHAGKGTGLGLSISYSLVQGFGGTLAVQSAEGQGTTFTVTLPAVEAETQPDRPTES
jgi:PAS domain S-box-containing protein